MMKILSLGAGVQSSAVLLASEHGLLPRLDAAIFADTGWEPAVVYRHLDWLKQQTNIPIHMVQNGNIRTDKRGPASMPMYIGVDGNMGIIRRQCTGDYKIDPIQRKIRELIGAKKRGPVKGLVQQWLGISTDEVRRAKQSSIGWIETYFPLILDLKWSRSDCLAWLAQEYPGHVIPRSACIGCPFKSDAEWLRLKQDNPEEFRQAVEFDYANRHVTGLENPVYLHKSGQPLDQVNLNENQQDMFEQECAGMCGV